MYAIFPATSADRFYRIDKAQVGFGHYVNNNIQEQINITIFCHFFTCACRSIFTS